MSTQKIGQSVFPKGIYVGAATRSPIGKFGGALKRFSAGELAALTLKEAIKRQGAAENPDFLLLGHARQAGGGPNTARQAVVFAGLPESVPAFTINQACASGLTAITTAAEKIALGKAKSIWAGGVESMSNTPYLLLDARWGKRLGHGEITDGMYRDGFMCPMAKVVMGETVQTYLADELKISRDEQDAYALSSQSRAALAWQSGLFDAETFEILAEAKQPGLKNDEHRREDTTMESLKKLPPVFDPKSGTVTAGNSSGITDGAAFVFVSSEINSQSMAELIDFEIVALDPKRMGLGPVPAINNLLKRHRLKVEDFEAVEINEAFAAQVLACQRELKIPAERLNPRGGSIALGHPIGASGARISVTLLHSLKGKSGALGLAALCVSGGMGLAAIYKAL